MDNSLSEVYDIQDLLSMTPVPSANSIVTLPSVSSAAVGNLRVILSDSDAARLHEVLTGGGTSSMPKGEQVRARL